MQLQGISHSLILTSLIAGIILLPVTPVVSAEAGGSPTGSSPLTGDVTSSRRPLTELNMGVNEERLLMDDNGAGKLKIRKRFTPAELLTFIGFILLIRLLNMVVLWVLFNRYREDEPIQSRDIIFPATHPSKLL